MVWKYLSASHSFIIPFLFLLWCLHIWINVFYLQQLAIAMLAVTVCVFCTCMVAGGTPRSWEWHHTPLGHCVTSVLQNLESNQPRCFLFVICLSYLAPEGSAHLCHVAVLLYWWNGVCGSSSFPMVMSRGFLQKPALLQVCFFDLSHSFLNMRQCKYMY